MTERREPAPDGTGSEPIDGAEGGEVPAPAWARLLLAAIPFVVAALVFLLLRNIRG